MAKAFEFLNEKYTDRYLDFYRIYRIFFTAVLFPLNISIVRSLFKPLQALSFFSNRNNFDGTTTKGNVDRSILFYIFYVHTFYEVSSLFRRAFSSYAPTYIHSIINLVRVSRKDLRTQFCGKS